MSFSPDSPASDGRARASSAKEPSQREVLQSEVAAMLADAWEAGRVAGLNREWASANPYLDTDD